MRNLLLIASAVFALSTTAQTVEIGVINSVSISSATIDASGGAPIYFENETADHFLVSTNSDGAPLSIDEPDQLSTQLLVYPNPATDVLNLNDTYEQVQVYNMQGQLILSKSKSNQLYVSELPPGTYFVRVNDGSSVKFIKH